MNKTAKIVLWVSVSLIVISGGFIAYNKFKKKS